MENHPIPQDVTGFQFRLIGDMTVKQFAYLAGGVILGWIAFSSLPLPGFFKMIAGGFFVGIGAAFAFIPIDGRPLDLMVSNFIKALFVPNQYVYQKQGGHISMPTITVNTKKMTPVHMQLPKHSQKELQAYLNKLPKQPKNKLDEKESAFFSSLFDTFKNDGGSGGNPQVLTAHDGSHASKISDKQKEAEKRMQEITKAQTSGVDEEKIKVALEKEEETVKKELESAHNKELAEKAAGKIGEAHRDAEILEKELETILMQKAKIDQDLQLLQKKLQEQQVVTPAAIAQNIQQESSHVRLISKDMGIQAGVPITNDYPNLLSGIVKDSRGNVLPNVLVEVKDQAGNPVRAFKTNGLGQFNSATALSNGNYTIEFEDSKNVHKFDTVALVATGEIMLPLEVTSTDAREELRKQLFA